MRTLPRRSSFTALGTTAALAGMLLNAPTMSSSPAVRHTAYASVHQPTPHPAAAPTRVPAPASAVPAASIEAARSAALGESMGKAARGVVPHARVGFEVLDRDTGTVLAHLNTQQQFPSMSLVKLLIALDTLDRGPRVPPDAATQGQLHRMLAASDDAIANALWQADGGPALVRTMATLLGLSGTQPSGDQGEWGDTLVTPHDLVSVYRYITDQLPAPDRSLILDALTSAPEIAADGTNQYFGIPHGLPRAAWAIKQGWGSSGADAVMGSTGLVGSRSRYIVVLLASAPLDSYAALPAALTAAARTLGAVLPD